MDASVAIFGQDGHNAAQGVVVVDRGHRTVEVKLRAILIQLEQYTVFFGLESYAESMGLQLELVEGNGARSLTVYLLQVVLQLDLVVPLLIQFEHFVL